MPEWTATKDKRAPRWGADGTSTYTYTLHTGTAAAAAGRAADQMVRYYVRSWGGLALCRRRPVRCVVLVVCCLLSAV
jgi:hypothetical protein